MDKLFKTVYWKGLSGWIDLPFWFYFDLFNQYGYCHTWRVNLSFGKLKKIRCCRTGWLNWLKLYCVMPVSMKVWTMNKCIAMLQHPTLVIPLLRPLPTHESPQLPQGFQVELTIIGEYLCGIDFYNAFIVKENNQHHFTIQHTVQFLETLCSFHCPLWQPLTFQYHNTIIVISFLLLSLSKLAWLSRFYINLRLYSHRKKFAAMQCSTSVFVKSFLDINQHIFYLKLITIIALNVRGSF